LFRLLTVVLDQVVSRLGAAGISWLRHSHECPAKAYFAEQFSLSSLCPLGSIEDGSGTGFPADALIISAKPDDLMLSSIADRDDKAGS